MIMGTIRFVKDDMIVRTFYGGEGMGMMLNIEGQHGIIISQMEFREWQQFRGAIDNAYGVIHPDPDVEFQKGRDSVIEPLAEILWEHIVLPNLIRKSKAMIRKVIIHAVDTENFEITDQNQEYLTDCPSIEDAVLESVKLAECHECAAIIDIPSFQKWIDNNE
jgi:hypothetical protein